VDSKRSEKPAFTAFEVASTADAVSMTSLCATCSIDTASIAHVGISPTRFSRPNDRAASPESKDYLPISHTSDAMAERIIEMVFACVTLASCKLEICASWAFRRRKIPSI
jgi:hypothetical protein